MELFLPDDIPVHAVCALQKVMALFQFWRTSGELQHERKVFFRVLGKKNCCHLGRVVAHIHVAKSAFCDSLTSLL